MKIRKVVTFISILCFTTLSLIISYPLKATDSYTTHNVRAQSSDSFVESMGISTKFGFCPGHLCDNYSEVKTLLGELGIRYIRDVAFAEPWRIYTDLYEDYGIRMLAETGRIWLEPLNSANISAQLNAIKLWGEMIVGIVGVNEYDSSGFNSCEESENCDPNWSEQSWRKGYRAYQKRLYNSVKADPELRHLPVVMGPMAHLDNLEKVGSLKGICDKGNDHTYPGAIGKPSQESGGSTKISLRSIDEAVKKVQQVCPNKKLWITETGYEEKVDGQQDRYLVTRQAKAKYLPRIYANYYLQEQIEKTFLFELLVSIKEETQTGYGIIDTNLEPTPAYYAIKNMISLLDEATWDEEAQSWQYPDFKTSHLQYTLEGDNTNIKHLLLQKSDGTFYLLLWQEVHIYDYQEDKNIFNPNRPLKLNFGGKVVDKANKYLLYNEDTPDAELKPLETWRDVSILSLSVPDHILVLEFDLRN